jgi:hypothetical protein
VLRIYHQEAEGYIKADAVPLYDDEKNAGKIESILLLLNVIIGDIW